MSLTSFRVLFVFVCVCAPAVARADQKSACVASYSSSQDSRTSGKLIEALRDLHVCASATCPAFIARDCAQWLEQVEANLPTIVISAKDDVGHDLADVTVRVDDVSLLETLDGRAVPINPGPHVLTFGHGDYPVVVQNIVVRTGEKNRAIDLVFAKPKVEETRVEKHELPPPLLVVPVMRDRIEPNPLRTVGFVTLAVGAASLALGGASGIAALVTKGDHCTSNVCDPGTVSTLSTETTLSTVALIAGAVLAATGVTLVFVGKPRHTTVVAVGPSYLFARW